MRKLVMIICVAVLGSALSVAADWSLVWEENFSGDAIDTTVWKRIPRGKSDWNNYMSPADSLFAQRDGNLILRGVVNLSFSRILNVRLKIRGFLTFVVFPFFLSLQ